MVEELGIVVTEILGYKGENKRHAELQDTLNKYIRIQKHYEYAQWVDRDRIQDWYLPYPQITYEEYITLKANIGARRDYLNRLHKKIKWIKQEIQRTCREYSLTKKKK